MFKRKIITFITLLTIMLICFANNVYAAACEITIEDSTDTTGFVEKDGKLYYVITVKAKTAAANLVGAKFQIKYDTQYLTPIKLENNATLDLGNKGTFKGPMLDLKSGLGVNINQETLLYMGTSEQQIENSEVNLVSVCFEVKDGKREKRAVYINKENADIPTIGLNLNEKYITNGVSQEDVSKLDNIMETTKKPVTVEYDDGTKETKEIEITPEEKAKQEEAQRIAEEAKKLNGKNDPTTANVILPNTGVKTVLVVIGVLAIIGIIAYIKMKKYKNILK